MAKATRRELREAVFVLLFETDFRKEELPADILASAREEREVYEDPYIDQTYLGVIEKMPVLDVMIARFSKGWKVSRLSHVSRAVLRLGAYELMYSDLPVQIAMNEAIVLAKKFEDPKARPFVNGVLNGIKDEIEATGKVECVAKIEAAVKETEGETTSESANSTAPAEEV